MGATALPVALPALWVSPSATMPAIGPALAWGPHQHIPGPEGAAFSTGAWRC